MATCPSLPSASADEPDLFQIDGVSEFDAKFLGSAIASKRSPSALIEFVDISRRSGLVAWKGLPSSAVKIMLSKYGMKVTNSGKTVSGVSSFVDS
eukprot:m.299463 g.299463  ORF g.299463 m.299463 type:complete len:95 (+) comp55186_c0_seq11:84-368(+)